MRIILTTGTMRITQKTLNHIKQFEGCRLEAYKDAVGIWTIGYGQTFGVTKGMTITQERADEWIVEYIESLESALEAIPGLKNLSQNRWDAIVSFTYNVGIGNLRRSTLLKKIQNNPNGRSIYTEFLRWDKAKGKRLEGLTRRRQWESKRWEGEV